MRGEKQQHSLLYLYEVVFSYYFYFIVNAARIIEIVEK